MRFESAYALEVSDVTLARDLADEHSRQLRPRDLLREIERITFRGVIFIEKLINEVFI